MDNVPVASLSELIRYASANGFEIEHVYDY